MSEILKLRNSDGTDTFDVKKVLSKAIKKVRKSIAIAVFAVIAGASECVDECSDGLPLGIQYHLNTTDCVSLYGDDTAMGGPYWLPYDLDATQRRRLGATVPHETVEAPGTFFLLPRTVPSTQSFGIEQLIIPTFGGIFSLEYNLKGKGIEVRFRSDTMPSNKDTETIRIIDTPDDISHVFKEGDTWTDNGRNISVTIGALTPEEAIIIVERF